MPPITPDEQARALAEWLDSPVGTPVPATVDPEVLETVFALRPDLAPPPRVEVDDILAMVTTGPLAPEPESLASAPVEAIPEPANDPRPSRWLAWGGTSLLLAAMAALFAVQLDTPIYAPPVAPEPTTSSVPVAGAEATPEEEGAEEVVADEAEGEVADAFDDGATEADRAADALGQMKALEKASRELREPAEAKEASAPRQEPAPPPTLQIISGSTSSRTQGDFAGGAEGGDSYAEDEEERAPAADMPVMSPPADPSPMDGADFDTTLSAEDAVSRRPAPRKSKDERSASDRLADIKAPVKSGQRAAIDAAEHFIAIGDPTRAAAACQKGLALSSANTRERERLLRLLGDARTAMGDPVTAAEAYQAAEELQTTR